MTSCGCGCFFSTFVLFSFVCLLVFLQFWDFHQEQFIVVFVLGVLVVFIDPYGRQR